MKVSLYCVIFFSSLLFTSEATLQLVYHVFVNGASAPTDEQMKAYYNAVWQTVDRGGILGIGLRQASLLGREIRTRYLSQSIIPQSYDPERIYISSLSEDKCIQTANAFLYGLFPESNERVSTGVPPVLVQPQINISNVPASNGYALPLRASAISIPNRKNNTVLQGSSSLFCPNVVQFSKNARSSTRYTDVINNFQSYYNQIQTTLGAKNVSTENVNQIWWSLRPDAYLNIPQRITDAQFYSQFSTLRSLAELVRFYDNADAKKIYVRPFLEEMFSWMSRRINQQTKTTYVGVSTTEETLAYVLTSLGVISTDCLFSKLSNGQDPNDPNACPDLADFTSSLIFELHTDTSNVPYIKFFYDDRQYKICSTAYQSGSLDCEYFPLVSNLRNTTTSSYDLDCGNWPAPQGPDPEPYYVVYHIWVGILGATMIIALVIAIALWVVLSKLPKVPALNSA
eukprot:TRINITY_DN9129_c0_g1_i1.p1 TRINITY_DN9129_c0_g1~~TRINITY_DN9129_c0_g1_i1.p1  ORF type:complete len:455 (-),score=85.33 TRINITY_DN9129_c0_g1_i1:165-1529(-)